MGHAAVAMTMVSARRPARSLAALAPERAAGRPTAGQMSREGLRGAAGGGRRAGRGGRVRPVWPPRGRRLLGCAALSRSRRCPSTCGWRRVLLAMSEPLPEFLDRLWGPWLGTRTPPLRGPASPSPSKVASSSAPPGQPRFLSGGVTQESPSSGLGGTWLLSSSVDRELDKLRDFFSLHTVIFCDFLTPVQP